jgi:ribosomal protein S4
MRLDLALFYLKISTSLKESKFLIKKGLIYVNQIKITKADFKLDKFSIIEIKGDNNKQVLSYVKHEINDLLGNSYGNLSRLNPITGIIYKNSDIKLPKFINLEIMRRIS